MNKESKFYLLKVEDSNSCMLFRVINETRLNSVFIELLEVFNPLEAATPSEIIEPSENREYLDIFNKVRQYVIAEKHFLDKNITINIVVRKCAVKKNSLNKVLRLKVNMAFHAYINRLRVIYASSLLLDPSNKLIDVVASEASFNNTRTFVRNFKVEYHMTPSEYRRCYGVK